MDKKNKKKEKHPRTVVLDVKSSDEDQNCFCTLCKYVYFCGKVGHFKMGLISMNWR